MKRISLLGTVILAVSLAAGFATVSQADLEDSVLVYFGTYNKSNNKPVIYWSLPDTDYLSRINTSFKIYRSPALSRKVYLENKEVKYKKIAAVSYDKFNTKDEDGDYRNYTRRLKNLKKDKYYRYKIETYYGKKLVSTDYCGGSSTAQRFSYSWDQVNAKKCVFEWDTKDRDNNEIIKFYLSEPVKSNKDDKYNIRYKEYGEVSAKKGKFTIKGLKPGKDYYYYFVGLDGDKELYAEYGRIGTMPTVPDINGSGFSKDSIAVPFSTWSNNNQDGMFVYRKNRNGIFVKIGEVTTDGENYIDKNVQAGRSYTYKARSYMKIDGKTYYSLYTDEVTVNAVNKEAKIKISVDKKDKSVIKIESSDMYNGIISDWDTCFNNDPKLYGIKQYSLDGVKWINTDGTDIPALSPKKTIYFRLNKELFSNNTHENLSMTIDYGKGPWETTTYKISYDSKDNSSSCLSVNNGNEC